jgi:flagellar hook-associated protein 2
VKTGTAAHLVIAGKNTGSLNEVTFAETGTAALGMTTYQSAANAKIKLDDQFTIERATNQFTDVLDGVTITAKTVSATPVSISVKSDPDAQASKIQGFVDAFNNAISSGHLAAGWGSITASNTELSGDSSVRSALSLLGTTVSNTVPGLTGKYNQLATVGVKLSQDGTLSLDKTKLAAALEADPEGVAKLFIGDSATSTKGAMSIMTTAIDRITKATTGTIAVRLTQFDNQLKRLSSDYDALQLRLDSYEAGLRKKFTALETTVSNIQYQGKQLSGFVSNSTNNNG